jgi:hypothetical protein
MTKYEVKNQYNSKIKTIRTYHGGEYNGKYSPYGQISGPFARFSF